MARRVCRARTTRIALLGRNREASSGLECVRSRGGKKVGQLPPSDAQSSVTFILLTCLRPAVLFARHARVLPCDRERRIDYQPICRVVEYSVVEYSVVQPSRLLVQAGRSYHKEFRTCPPTTQSSRASLIRVSKLTATEVRTS